MDRKENFVQAVETMTDFDIWSNKYLCEDVDMINAMLKMVNKLMIEEQDKEEVDKEELEFCKFRLNTLIEAKKITDTYKDYLTPIAEDVERLEDLTWIALGLLKECGLNKLYKVEVNIDMRDNKERLGYYFPTNKKIFIHKHTLDNYSNTEIIEVLLHEYIHAYLDIHFGNINDKVSKDESIIFSVMVERVNKKLKRLQKGYKIYQNGINELNYKYFFKDKFKKLTDLRKNIKTIKNDIVTIIFEILDKYETLLLLENKNVNRYKKEELNYIF